MPENTLANAEALRSLASSLGYYVDSMDGLRQHRGQVSGQVFLRGYYKAGDGAEGFFMWDEASTLPDNAGTIIDPSGAATSGRWIRITRAASVTPLWWGARFDDSTDDTRAIQAAIDFAVSTGADVLLPPGTAKITQTLTLSTAGHRLQSGFRFAGRGKFGDSGASMRDGSGTLLKFYGDTNSAPAIVNIDRSLWRYTTVSDVSLICVTPAACRFGILFSSSEFSQHSIENVTVDNVKIAFAILKGSGANGEFTRFTNCSAGRVSAFFYNNSGQAFTHRFDHCTCGLLSGGTYFILDIASGISPGGGLIVTDFNATGGAAGDPTPPTNTTLFQSNQSISPVSFSGGRVEHLTRLFNLLPDFVGLNLSIRNMEFTIDCDPTLKGYAVGALVTVHDNASIISISDCRFDATKGKEVFGIDVTDCADYGPIISFANCDLGGFVASPKILGLRQDTMTLIQFADCRLSTNFRLPVRGGRMGSDRKQPLNMRWGAMAAEEAVRSRSLSATNALIASGRPSNLLSVPAICTFNGSLDAKSSPDAPWIAIGNASGFRVSRADLAAENIRSSSPWARTIVLEPGCGIYQDVSKIDLAAESDVSRYFYAPVHELFYQSLISSIDGKGSLRIALENSVNEEIYDETVLKGSSAQSSGPHLISLLARVPPLDQPSHFRLKIHNTGTAGTIMLSMAWQFASPKQDGSYVGIEGVSELQDRWAMSAESVRAWGRFMLPYKSDGVGSAAANPAKDLYSDQYMSADDGRLTYFAGNVWCKAPRTLYGDGPPEHGSWRVADQFLNLAPKSGSYVGWICTNAGSPGEWRPFGLIG